MFGVFAKEEGMLQETVFCRTHHSEFSSFCCDLRLVRGLVRVNEIKAL